MGDNEQLIIRLQQAILNGGLDEGAKSAMDQAVDVISSQTVKIRTLESDAERAELSALEVIQGLNERIRNLGEIKDGYYAGMLAWRRQAEDGIPIEVTLDLAPAPSETAVAGSPESLS